MSASLDDNSQSLRRSKRTPSKSKAVVGCYEDEISEDEVASDSSFSVDLEDKSPESFHDSDWSQDQHRKSKKRKRSLGKQPKKKKKPAKKALVKSVSKSSRRSTRRKSQPDYCEDSSDDEVYELLDGQPLKLNPNKQHNKTSNKNRTKPFSKSNKSSRKNPSVNLSNLCKSGDIVLSPEPLADLISESLRDVRQTRSQVSYAEESSDDFYELCDGQPIRSDLISRVSLPSHTNGTEHKKSLDTSNPMSTQNNDDLDNNSVSSDKVVIVKGQPIFLSQAITMYADDNSFVANKQAIQDLASNSQAIDQFCIWKLYGKLMQKFIQVDTSKIFESTSNYLANDEDVKDQYEPVKAIVFDKKLNHFLAEVLECSENEVILSAIKSRSKVLSSSRLENGCALNSNQQKSDKRCRKRKASSSKSSSHTEEVPSKKPSRQRKTRKHTTPAVSSHVITETFIPKLPEEVLCEVENLNLSSFTPYVKALVTMEMDKSYRKRLLSTDSSAIKSLRNSLSSLADSLLKITTVDSAILVDLKTLSTANQCNELDTSSTDTVLVLSGKRYDQQTLADDLTCEDTTKQFRLSREDIKICRAYHDIYHFEKHLIESCRNKFFCLSNAADIHDHIKNEVQTVVKTLIDRVDDGRCDDDDKDEVKNLLSSLLDRVGDKDSKEIVKNEVQTALTSLSDQVDNTTCEKKDEVEDKVKRTLTALLDEIEDGDDKECDDVLNVVKQTVSDVMEQVALVIHTRTSTALLKVDDFMSEDWLSQMLNKLKTAVRTACELLPLNKGA